MLFCLGTAVTCDLVTAEGHHYGGFITVGPELGLKSLAQSTGLLPDITANDKDFKKPGIYGQTTNEAMLAGVSQSLHGLVSYTLQQISTDFPEKKVIPIATGGYLDWLNHPTYPIKKVKNLNLLGLDIALWGG